MEERIVTCRLAGKDYPMALTVRATKAVTERYGDLGELGEKLQTASYGEQLDMAIWLLARLILDGCDLQRYLHPEKDTPPAPDEDLLSLLLRPGDLQWLRPTIMRCMTEGMDRDVPTEDDGKNPAAGSETGNSSPG